MKKYHQKIAVTKKGLYKITSDWNCSTLEPAIDKTILVKFYQNCKWSYKIAGKHEFEISRRTERFNALGILIGHNYENIAPNKSISYWCYVQKIPRQ